MQAQSLNGACTYVAAYRSLPLSGCLLHLMSEDIITLLKKFIHKNFHRSPTKMKIFRLNNLELRGEFFQNYGSGYAFENFKNSLHDRSYNSLEICTV